MSNRLVLSLVFTLFCSQAWSYVDPSLDAKTTALAHYLEASQNHQINIGATRTTSGGGDNYFPTTGMKQPKMQVHEMMKDFVGNPGASMLWGSDTQRTKLETNYASGTTIVMLSFNPWNPSTTCSNGCGFPDRTGDPVHRIKVGDPAYDSASRARWVQNLDALVAELQRLSTDGIPVILRYPQENNCPWDWWGKSTNSTTGASGAEYISLMREITDYILAAGVHNVLYGYSPDFNSNASCADTTTIDGSFYPGNSYVDVIMASLYINASDFSSTARLSADYAAMAAAAARTGKIWGIAEGPIDFTSAGTLAYAPTFWTWYFDFIKNDANAKNAAFINFWGSPKWWTVSSVFENNRVPPASPVHYRSDVDFANMLTAQGEGYEQFIWQEADQIHSFTTGAGIQYNGLRLNGLRVK